MSLQSLPTQCGSSETLGRGLQLASRPLAEMLQLKEEPADEEEVALRKEMQVLG